MGRVTGSWERPIQGVSQQADKDRINGQCTLQENLVPSPLKGLVKRTGTQFLSELMTTVSEDALWYSYSRGTNEDYIILIEPDEYPRVFDLTGDEKTVNVSAPVSDTYLKVTNPKANMRLKTIADFTFILNNTIEVEVLDTITPYNDNIAIVYCQFATYGRDYVIECDGEAVASIITPDGADTTDIEEIKTNNIINQLTAQINSLYKPIQEEVTVEHHFTGGNDSYYYADLSEVPITIYTIKNITTGATLDATSYFLRSAQRLEITSGVSEDDELLVTYNHLLSGASEYTATADGNTMFLERLDGEVFSINTIDSASGNDLIAVQDKVKNVTNLPPRAPEGYIVKIENQEGYDANAYYLKAENNVDEDKTGSEVRWVESTAQGAKYDIDGLTMPHVLISEANGTFTLKEGEWEDRQVGDDLTNPFPTFAGSTIISIGAFQNRMVFTSGESAIFSRTNRFFDFFKESAQASSDSDPIDVFSDAEEINNLTHHKVLDGDIVFFSNNGQFIVKGDTAVTPNSINFTRATTYPVNLSAEPAVTGESIMFTFPAGKYAGVREMFTDSITDTKRARPLTDHIAEYIEGTPTDLIASPNINKLLIKTDLNSNLLYVHDWLWVGEQKVQSAFSKWIFDGDVLFAKFIKDKLYFVIQREDAVTLEVMPVGNDLDDNGLDFSVALDRRDTVNATWDGERWEWTMPFTMTDTSSLEFVRGEDSWEDDKGTSVIFEVDGATYFSYDDLADTGSGVTSCTLTCGTTYKAKYTPTQPFIKDKNDRTIGLDRFTLGKVTINYESIGYIDVIVRDLHSRREWNYDYNGRRMGGYNNRIGFAPLDSGTFAFPVRLQSQQSQIEISTSDYRPLIIRNLEWEGMFRQRGRRL